MSSFNNVSALTPQSNLNVAQKKVDHAIAALSSGNRIIRASDDVAGLSIGTLLRTTVSTLKTALKNAGQAATLLQIADGGLQKIGEILQRQEELAASANSGTLTDVERGYLNQEFQSNTTEINRIVTDTKFNSVQLLDGSLFDKSDISTNVSDPLGEGSGKGVAASGSIDFSPGNVTAGEFVTLNGVKVYFTATGGGKTVQVGATKTASAQNLQAFLAASDIDQLKQATYSISTTTVTITAKQTGTIGNAYTVVEGTANLTVSGATLTGGTNGDLEASATIANGTVTIGSSDVIGDGIITALSATAPVRATATYTIAAGNVSANDTVNVNGVIFTFGAALGNVPVGASATVSALNLAEAFNQSTNPLLTNIYASSAAGVVTFTYTQEGTGGNSVTISETGANTSVSGANFAGGAGSGIHVKDIVNNADFSGTISGFHADYISADRVQLSVVVGDHTYTGTVTDTTPGLNTQVRLYSSASGTNGGGYFDITLASGQGTTVSNQQMLIHLLLVLTLLSVRYTSINSATCPTLHSLQPVTSIPVQQRRARSPVLRLT